MEFQINWRLNGDIHSPASKVISATTAVKSRTVLTDACLYVFSLLAAVLCYKSLPMHFWSHVILNRSRNSVALLTSYVVVNDAADVRKKLFFY